MGRKPIGTQAMTAPERQQRRRAKLDSPTDQAAAFRMALMRFLARAAQRYPQLRPGTVAHALRDQANSAFVHYELWKAAAPNRPREKSKSTHHEGN
jgi:hypothetical protein